jgi:hypothetical protein
MRVDEWFRLDVNKVGPQEIALPDVSREHVKKKPSW